MDEKEVTQLEKDVENAKKVILEPTEVAVIIVILVVLVGTIGVALFTLKQKSNNETYQVTFNENGKSTVEKINE